MSETEEIKPPLYDSKKGYEWAPDAKFDLEGVELEYQFKVISELLATPEAQQALKLYEIYKILEGKIAAGVATGIVTETSTN